HVPLSSVLLHPTPHLSLFDVHDTAPTLISTLSLHDALPISLLVAEQLRVEKRGGEPPAVHLDEGARPTRTQPVDEPRHPALAGADRKSTRLNSSHGSISYAVFCLKKKRSMQTLAVIE